MDKSCIQWAVSCLQEKGCELINASSENVQSTPWSDVVRFKSTSGNVYLKKTPALIYEPSIIQLLHDQLKAPVPELIARNDDLHCFIMKDAGEHLRVLLKKKFDVGLACKAIDTFAALQLATSTDVDVLIDAGVPDWRLDKMPKLYQELLRQKNLLLEDGLKEAELRDLVALQSAVSDLCQKIAEYRIPQTIVQPDFNDNNSLIDQGMNKITIIDLGELAITHPFFSMYNWLQVMGKHHSIKEGDETYHLMLDRYLQYFKQYGEVLEVFYAIAPLCYIYVALASFRLIEACGVIEIMSLQRGKLSEALRRFAKSIS